MPPSPRQIDAAPPGRPTLRTAIVHDWLTGMRGGEKVLVELCRLLPRADLYALLHMRGTCTREIEDRTIRTSFLDDLPGIRHYYRHLLPLMPLAVESLDLGGYDLVVSSSHCAAKGFGGRRPGQVHVCYCHAPMRYVWTAGRAYRRRLGMAGLALAAAGPFLRAWDRRSAGRVDLFLANSACVAGRIRSIYGRPAAVLYPPVDTEFFRPGEAPREDFYLVVSALAPYKRVEQAMAACESLGRRLMVIGSGPDMRRLRRRAGGGVSLLGWRDDATVLDHYRRCRALVMPQEEDFGLAALEAMACGTPVIAYAGGGALETVLDAADLDVARPTGLLYRPQTPEALAQAIRQFERLRDAGRFDPAAARAWAMEFSTHRFAEGFRRAVEPLLADLNR